MTERTAVAALQAAIFLDTLVVIGGHEAKVAGIRDAINAEFANCNTEYRINYHMNTKTHHTVHV